ncbi:MAG: hypothetical protein LBB41_02300 [Prevotellaceae bacterium]|jgi:hypothetical protein|nr:hypothetical protein [Prevotellaceae bacterium]
MAANKWNDVERVFIKETLENHGEYLMDLLQNSIESKGLIETQELLDSLDFETFERPNGDFYLYVYFPDYGRFIEINYFKSKSIRKEKIKEGVKSKNLRRHKDTRFYSKNVYGSINRLIGLLGSNYSEAMIQSIKQKITNAPNIIQSMNEMKLKI